MFISKITTITTNSCQVLFTLVDTIIVGLKAWLYSSHGAQVSALGDALQDVEDGGMLTTDQDRWFSASDLQLFAETGC